MPTSKQKERSQIAQSTPNDEPLHEGNRIPAQFTCELADYEAEIHITPEVVTLPKGEAMRQVVCCLSRQCYAVATGSVTYMIRSLGDDYLFDPSYVHPDVVARGSDYIRRLVLERAARERSDIRYKMERVVMMERGAALDIVFDLPGS